MFTEKDYERANWLAQKRVDSAVEEIRAQAQKAPNTSGLCCDCGFAIDPRRLAVKPDAECCLECQKIRDRRGA